MLRGRNKVTWTSWTTSSLGNWVFRSQLTLSRYKQATVKEQGPGAQRAKFKVYLSSYLQCECGPVPPAPGASFPSLHQSALVGSQLTCARSPPRRKKSPAPEAEAFSIMGDGWLSDFTRRKIMQTNVSCKTPGSISKVMKMQWWGLIINACWDGRENQGPGVGTAVWEAEERLWEEGWGAWQLEVGKSQARLLGHTRSYFRAWPWTSPFASQGHSVPSNKMKVLNRSSLWPQAPLSPHQSGILSGGEKLKNKFPGTLGLGTHSLWGWENRSADLI